MPRKKIEHIKKRVLIPFALALFTVLAAGIGGMYWLQRQNRAERVRTETAQLDKLFHDLLADEAGFLNSLLAYYGQDPGLRQAYLAGDRQELLRRARPLFASIRATEGVSHFYFFDPNRRVFLRVHKPEDFGDISQQYSLAKSVRTGKTAHGLELGRFGHLTLRVVRPWLVNGKLIGYLELGKEIDHFTQKMKKILKVELFFSINKKYLQREHWHEGLKMLGRSGNWEEFPHCVVIDRTTPEVPPEICRFLDPTAEKHTGTVFESMIRGRHYSRGVVPLIDASGVTLGNIVMFFDITDETTSLVRLSFILIGAAVFLVLLLYVSFFFYMARLDRRMVGVQESMSDELAAHETKLSRSNLLLQQDIAKREKVEHEFQRVCERNRLILEAAGQGIFGLDAQGANTFANPAAAAMLGYEVEELLGMDFHALCHHTRVDGASHPPEECLIYKTLRDGETHRVGEDVFWRKDGTNFWVEYTSTPLREDGGLAGAVVAFQDITPRKRALDDLEESEERYRAIFSMARDAIILINSVGRVAYWSPAAEKIFGYSQEEALGRDMHELIAPARDREKCHQGIVAFQQTGNGNLIGKTVELMAMRKNGEEFSAELSLSALKKKEEWWAVGVVRDSTERLWEEKEKEELQTQLRQSQKMEAIGTLAGGIAHDFNNILGAIMGYAELAIMENEHGKTVQGHLKEIRRASLRAKDLVSHILTFSRQTEMSRQPVNISPIVKEALKMLRASLPATIEIKRNIARRVGKIMADPTQIHQVLMNLCTNAAHAMREAGGVLEVTLLEETFATDTILREFSLPPGSYVKLSIRDTGHGMDESTLERIFEPFFTSKERGEGTGMGLAMVHGIVKSHGGAITVASRPGSGATFTMYFPVIEAAGEAEQTAVTAMPLSGQQERVLFIDDEEQLVELGQRILEYLGYEVTTRTDSREALELFRRQPDGFDLIVTDQTMPRMTGVELAKEMLAIRPDTPIILCTGFSEAVSEEQVLTLGIKGYIMKPLSIHDLAKTCRTALED